ncbi:MAG TPA: Hpt domain-containing protein, partial [Chthoniobacterales bacterium]|nr:Hpt domain-containing protein [Chthoniobacterales bacterium]
MNPPDDLGAFSMEQLFQMEVETQSTALSEALVSLEAGSTSPELLTTLMRAAHSIKGAARIVNNDEMVKVAHVMEDSFVLGQKGVLAFNATTVDLMLRGVDLLKKLSGGSADASDADAFVRACTTLNNNPTSAAPAPAVIATEAPAPEEPHAQKMLRVDATKLDRLLGFAGEGLVAARQLEGFIAELQRMSRSVQDSTMRLQSINGDPIAREARLQECREGLAHLETALRDRHATLDAFSRRWNLQAERLYEEALSCRMRPLSDILPSLRRLVRDLARELGKSATLEIVGADTPVDRE